jgi:hypothetical protein
MKAENTREKVREKTDAIVGNRTEESRIVICSATGCSHHGAGEFISRFFSV